MPAVRRNLGQTIVDDVLADIAAGRLTVGDRLPTHQELARRYGVGHSVVRDAVQRLAAMGILDVRPGRGSTIVAVETHALDPDTITALLSDESVEDLFALRRLIEVETAARAATHRTDADLRELDAVAGGFADALAAGRPVADLDVELHRVIARASGRPLLLRVLDALSDALGATRREATRHPGASAVALEEHAAVIDAIEAGDAAAAAAAMADHLDTAYRTILAVRRRPNGVAAE